MKINYEFADETASEVEVEESIGAVIIEERRLEDNLALMVGACKGAQLLTGRALGL